MPVPSTVNHVRRPGTHARKATVSSTEQPKRANVMATPVHQGSPISWALERRKNHSVRMRVDAQ